MMKRIVNAFLALVLILCGCSESSLSIHSATVDTAPVDFVENPSETVIPNNEQVLEIGSLSDPVTLQMVEDEVYVNLVTELDESLFIENVDVRFLSEEYITELAYNSSNNIYFGYTLDELNNLFEGKKYVFTVGDDGSTVVEQMETIQDTYWNSVLENVMIGSGIILVCVTVSSATASIPAVSMIFAFSAKSGAIAAASGSVITGASAGIIEYIQTGNFDKAIESSAIAASEAFKWGAIGGAIAGGFDEAIGLYGASLHGLTMNQAAQIQRETQWSLNVIKNINNMDQYAILKSANVRSSNVNGALSLIRDIDLDYIDESGRTNLQRMVEGLAPLDGDGIPYELHHLGQTSDSPIAILTRAEHRQGGNHKIWHYDNSNMSDNPSSSAEWNNIRQDYWKSLATMVGG